MEGKSRDLYAVLGLNQECSVSELRHAYKKLALRWHPDRCSAEESKKNFQAIQHAYSEQDMGFYDSDDDENVKGMGDFLNEMAVMMSETKANNVKVWELIGKWRRELRRAPTALPRHVPFPCNVHDQPFGTFDNSSSYAQQYPETISSSNKRATFDVSNGGAASQNFVARQESFSVGTGGRSTGCKGGEGSKKRGWRRNKR